MGADHTFWYLTRAAGFIAYILLFGSVTLGLVLTTSIPKGYRRFDIFDIHRFLALLALFVTIFHMFIVLPDQFIGFTVWELLVPFTSPYAQFYMGLGTLAVYLMAIVIGTFYLRPLVPYSAWRTIHYATFAVYAMALVHGIGAGSDTSVTWALGLYAVTGGIVWCWWRSASATARCAASRQRSASRRRAGRRHLPPRRRNVPPHRPVRLSRPVRLPETKQRATGCGLAPRTGSNPSLSPVASRPLAPQSCPDNAAREASPRTEGRGVRLIDALSFKAGDRD